MTKEQALERYVCLLKQCFEEVKEGEFIPALFVQKCMEELKNKKNQNHEQTNDSKIQGEG